MEEPVVSESTAALIRHYLPSNADLADMCAFFSLFSDVTRMKMISALSITELCVSDIAMILGLNQTTVSHQLKLLRDAGAVSTRREGKIIFYRIVNRHIADVMMTGAIYLCEILPPERKREA